MAGIDHEAEYNNRRRVAEAGEIMARWAAASGEARATLRSERDIAYGPRPRQRYDLFAPAGGGESGAPLVVYIHGGYWQRGERSEYAFLAPAITAAGAALALPSYTLAPEASVGEITEEIAAFLAALWQHTGRRAVVAGHSAGGHLAAEMLARDWSRQAGAPADLVRGAVAISGVFELAPLVPTTINAPLRLTPETAAAASPLLKPPPPRGRRFLAAVGGAESAEFLRQSRVIAEQWSKAGVTAESLVVPGANHFTVVDELARPGSLLLEKLLAMARACA